MKAGPHDKDKVSTALSVMHSRESAGVDASHNQKLPGQRKLADGRGNLGTRGPAPWSDFFSSVASWGVVSQ